jgi:predicted AlkP superfamily pyrophosphatase or phosphodiesterase
MQKLVVLNVVGLASRFLGPSMPRLSAWAENARVARIRPAFPAVTCTAQTNYLTGQYPDRHGIVSNGWYAHEDCEVKFWKQANSLVSAPKVWDRARQADASFTCANMFWWYNMYSTADYSVTPRPMYPADGRKIPDVYTSPSGLRDELQAALGTFPLFEFWGPRAGIRSTRWIAEATKQVDGKVDPTLTLVYLPHLDYNLQRVGVSDPSIKGDLSEIDDVAADLIRYYESHGADVMVLSEYGLCDVRRPVFPNRALRAAGLLAVREERGLDMLDPGASAAFAVADHQIAHVYVNDSSQTERVHELLAALPGVDQVLTRGEQSDLHVNHPRSGDLIAVAAEDAWFAYYYWNDDRRAPDYARTVDIHRKPGYDPVELFLDPSIRLPALTVGWKLLKRSLGLRSLLDVIPLDASLVRGSHGRPGGWTDDAPVCISRRKTLFDGDRLESIDVYALILRHLGLGG